MRPPMPVDELQRPPSSRAWVWAQLLFGWLPVWALFSLVVMSAHGASVGIAALIGFRLAAGAAVLGLAVHWLTGRIAWPQRFAPGFVALHCGAALAFSIAWLALNSLFESLLRGRPVLAPGPGVVAFLVTGVWFYVMIAAMAYAHRAAAREAEAAAHAARSQLANLRQQLHPHLLFNALHTVVQLIAIDPRAAVRAAEGLAGVLRTALEEQRDLVPLRDEWSFARRCLEIERIRFGERLQVDDDIAPEAAGCLLPSFALQTLVENAVRHGAAPKVEPTTIAVRARLDPRSLTVEVSDTGHGADPAALVSSTGTGLRRLRERLHWLYGGQARLEIDGRPGAFTARLVVPRRDADGDDGATSGR